MFLKWTKKLSGAVPRQYKNQAHLSYAWKISVKAAYIEIVNTNLIMAV